MKKTALLFLIYILGILYPFLTSQFSTLNSVAFAQLDPVERDLSISASVNPGASDFQFGFSSDGRTNVSQDQELFYQITYGASESAGFTTATTITVDFSMDRAPDGTHVLDYVLGSASNAYGGAKPVVNFTNRRITWTIPALPAGIMSQTITFKLRTNSNYPGTTAVNFTTSANMSNQYISMPQQTITQTYKFDPSLVPTPRTPTLQPTLIPTPTPTTTPATLQILNVSINANSPTAATIAVTTNRPAKQTIRFGTSPNALDRLVQTSQFSRYSTLDLTNLTPGTIYYFQITATGRDGLTRTSDIFTFTSAQKSETQTQPALAGNNAVAITSGEMLLLSTVLDENKPSSAFALLTTNTDYQLAYTFGHIPTLTNFEVIVRNQDGVFRTVHLTAHDAQTHIANLRSGGAGMYEIFVKQTDEKGNIGEQKVAYLKVVNPLRVLEKETNVPLSDARIFLLYFNPQTQRFEPLTQERLRNQKNPSYTDMQGEARIILLPGRYRVETSALGYDSTSVDFTLGEKEGQEYPSIYLEKNFFNMMALIHFIKDWLIDFYKGFQDMMQMLTSSIRFFNSMATLILLSFVLLSFLLFRLRTGIRWQHLIPYFLFHFFALANRHKQTFLHGIILTEKEQPVNNVRIDVMKHADTTILTHIDSNQAGKFHLRNTFTEPYIKILLTKDGFHPLEMMVPTDTRELIVIRMRLHSQSKTPFTSGSEHLAGEFFELFIFLSLLIELFFLFAFGAARTLPFFALSLINLLLWLFYQWEHKRKS